MGNGVSALAAGQTARVPHGWERPRPRAGARPPPAAPGTDPEPRHAGREPDTEGHQAESTRDTPRLDLHAREGARGGMGTGLLRGDEF